MAQKDYYEVLGIQKNASSEEIKAAYRKLALQWHPDRHVQDKKIAEEKFKEINQAYQILSDPQKKETYDQFGHSAFEQGGAGQGFGGQGYSQGPFNYTYYTSNPQGFDFSSGDFSDPFDIFEQFFGGASPFGQRRGPRRKSYSLTIDFMEAVKGVKKEVVIDGKKTTIKIPAGVSDGQRIRFSDFDIVLDIKPSAKYKREGDDLIAEEKISIGLAAIGGILPLETLDGVEKIKIHSGTQPGTLIRLRGKGVPHVRGGGRGDLYIKLNVRIPEKLTGRQKDLLREFEGEKKEKTTWF
jgi:DnaJ-class molecular chaperone